MHTEVRYADFKMFHVKHWNGGKMAKQNFYRLDKILKKECKYNILLGERSNGKSYAVKEFLLKEYKEHGRKFVYLRRAETEVKPSKVDLYWEDLKPVISAMFKGYDRITTWQGKLFLSYLTEEGKVKRGEVIGYTMYLSGATHFKSLAYPEVYNIVFEEFATDGLYLYDEPNQLQELVSTIIRRRNGRVFMIGNVISRVCPYFYTWELSRVPKQKMGTIDIYNFQTDQEDENGDPISINIAVEYCENSGNNSKMFFGSHAKTITGGMWKSSEQAKQPKANEAYEELYTFKVRHRNFNFIVVLKIDIENGGLFLYVYPDTKDRNIQRVIQKKFSTDPFVSEKLDPISFEVEKMVSDCLRKNKICFSDNLTGSDFRNVLADMGGI